ncbi:hypothetical protein PIROE2DRAFT_11756 [Piromyces sp. E2]|nr:hypothetical protein PIROE2DRAFT_11756 [Piromyces sp. E2]|eukprot:OUM62051.1 hypothetical protein PIROE2DRAFT_11756 [Piromyces sp. E2]
MELRKQYIDNLKYVIKHNPSIEYDNIIEGFHEWEIDNWKRIKGNETCSEFSLCGHYWDLKLNKNFSKLGNSLSSFEVTLRNKDSIKSEINYSCSISVREKYSYSDYITKEMYSSFDKDFYKNDFKTFLKSDNIVISVYMFLYVNTSKEKKVNFVNNLTHKLRNEDTSNYKLIGKDYYEWKIENWNGIKYNCDAEYSMKFNICGYNWKLKIYPNGVSESNNHVSLYLKNLDVGENKSHIFVKCSLFMANYDNYDINHIKDFSANFNTSNNTDGIKEFIPKNQLYESFKCYDPLIKDNKVVVGAYLYVYEYNKVDCIIKDAKELMEKRSNTKNQYVQEDYYEWTIDNWKKFKSNRSVVCSQEFDIGGHTWRIYLYPNGNSNDNRENVSLFLHCKNTKDVSLVHIAADYSLYILPDNTFIFSEYETENGCDQFIKINDLYARNKVNNKTLVEDNRLIIGVYIRVYRFGKGK